MSTIEQVCFEPHVKPQRLSDCCMSTCLSICLCLSVDRFIEHLGELIHADDCAEVFC